LAPFNFVICWLWRRSILLAGRNPSHQALSPELSFRSSSKPNPAGLFLLDLRPLLPTWLSTKMVLVTPTGRGLDAYCTEDTIGLKTLLARTLIRRITPLVYLMLIMWCYTSPDDSYIRTHAKEKLKFHYKDTLSPKH